MQTQLRHLAVVLAGAAATLATASGFACTIAPTNPNRIKQMMAHEIAHRLGMRPQQISLDSITTPQLQTPLGIGADCSGLGAYHHSSGFRIWGSSGSPGPWPKPEPGPGPGPAPDWPPRPFPGPGPAPDPDPDPDHLPLPGIEPRPGLEPWPGMEPRPFPRPGPHSRQRCIYEGVAVVLGQSYSSPVAVNFERRCR